MDNDHILTELSEQSLKTHQLIFWTHYFGQGSRTTWNSKSNSKFSKSAVCEWLYLIWLNTCIFPCWHSHCDILCAAGASRSDFVPSNWFKVWTITLQYLNQGNLPTFHSWFMPIGTFHAKLKCLQVMNEILMLFSFVFLSLKLPGTYLLVTGLYHKISFWQRAFTSMWVHAYFLLPPRHRSSFKMNYNDVEAVL